MDRRRFGRPMAAALTAALAVGVAAGCGSTAPGSGATGGTPTAPAATSTATGASQTCAALQAVGTDLSQLSALDPRTTTVAQVQSLLDRTKADVAALAQSAKTSAAGSADALNTAYNGLTMALANVPTSATAMQTYQAVQPQLAALGAAIRSVGSSLACPTPT